MDNAVNKAVQSVVKKAKARADNVGSKTKTWHCWLELYFFLIFNLKWSDLKCEKHLMWFIVSVYQFIHLKHSSHLS